MSDNYRESKQEKKQRNNAKNRENQERYIYKEKWKDLKLLS